MGKKVCIKCNVEKLEEEFPLRSSKTGKRHNRCKLCQRKYSRKHYKENRENHNKRRYVNQKKYRKRNRKNVVQYLKNNPCSKCNEPDYIVLEFHHLRDKDFNISEMVTQGFSWERILMEIEKCEVLCANCHRRLHYYSRKEK